VKKLALASKLSPTLALRRVALSLLHVRAMSALMSTSAHKPGPVSGTGDALFSMIERMQLAHRPAKSGEATASWGRFLDAGTGEI
jgi:hypothetical protein